MDTFGEWLREQRGLRRHTGLHVREVRGELNVDCLLREFPPASTSISSPKTDLPILATPLIEAIENHAREKVLHAVVEDLLKGSRPLVD